MERPYILHMFTPGRQMSPFDINMAADAGYQIIVPYSEVAREGITGLTQDTIFSRGPKGVARTGIFIGGRDVIMAADMLDAARKAMVPPFEVSVMADPSGSYTTAAALVACVEAQLRKTHGEELKGKKLTILGGTGTVGRIAGVLADQLGATVSLSSHRGEAAAKAAAEETNKRFGSKTIGVSGDSPQAVQASVADAEIVLATAAAGLQVMSAADVASARKLLVAADVNAVPPDGIAGVGVHDSGKLLHGTIAVGIGALTVGNVKYQVQHRLLVRMRESSKPVSLSFAEAMTMARDVLADAP
jgi:methylene-tetrahydromethanopterin dehydrogenase